MQTRASVSSGPDQPDLREIATNSLRYWESRRIAYNAVLFAIVLARFVFFWPVSYERISLNLGLILVLLAVLANAVFCLAYPPDVFVQLSAFRERWLRLRWVLLALGTLVAGIITNFWAVALFRPVLMD